MKKKIEDASFKEMLQQKLRKWISEQFRGGIPELPDIEILEIYEFPLQRLVLRAEAQIRSVSRFSRPGKAAQAAAFPQTLPSPALDPWSIETPKIEGFAEVRQTVELPASAVSTQCRSCGGSGKLSCPDCQGQKTVYCSVCHGDGFVTCQKCRKTLKINCQSCSGRGKVFSNQLQKYVDCEACGGKGTFPCRECNNGRNPCKDCGGQGRIPCVKCGQTGSLECKACSGEGSFIAGPSVDIVSFPLEAKTDLPNPDIPENISNGEFPVVSYAPGVPVELGGGNTRTGAQDALVSQAEALEQKLKIPPEARVILKAAFVENKIFYNFAYKAGDRPGSAWFVTAGEKIIFENKLSGEISSWIAASIGEKIKHGDTHAALRAIRSIEAIPALKAEAEKAEKQLNKSVIPVFAAGAAAGAAISAAAVLGYEIAAWKTSLHLASVMVYSAAALVSAAALSVWLLKIWNPEYLTDRKKRLACAAAIPAALGFIFVAASSIFGFNPAKVMDTKQMLREYRSYFPFGLRTLATREDVDFLQGLVDKYGPAGVDMASVNKDLSWLREKRVADEKAVERIEKTARAIERASENRNKGPKRARKTHPRIYVK